MNKKLMMAVLTIVSAASQHAFAWTGPQCLEDVDQQILISQPSGGEAAGIAFTYIDNDKELEFKDMIKSTFMPGNTDLFFEHHAGHEGIVGVQIFIQYKGGSTETKTYEFEFRKKWACGSGAIIHAEPLKR